MTLGLPGNPHEEYTAVHNSTAHAILALAYEVRTANLINYPYSDHAEIEARLGRKEES